LQQQQLQPRAANPNLLKAEAGDTIPGLFAVVVTDEAFRGDRLLLLDRPPPPGFGAGDVSPILGWLQMPVLKWAMFSPASVPPRFQAEYSPAMALRPSQIRATSVDGALMIPGALNLRRHYKNMTLPVVIIAGDGDKIVFKRRSKQLRDSIPGSRLEIVKGAGHMVHHVAMRQVAGAVESVTQSCLAPEPAAKDGQYASFMPQVER
jgi:pimeloyl-ACP methyl ester carboxylesterase